MEWWKQEGEPGGVMDAVKRVRVGILGGRGIAIDAVEAAVAAAGGAFEGVVAAAARHEFAATVEDMTTEAGRVVPEALPVPNCGVGLGGGGIGGPTTRS